jgi:hypothetical protein
VRRLSAASRGVTGTVPPASWTSACRWAEGQGWGRSAERWLRRDVSCGGQTVWTLTGRSIIPGGSGGGERRALSRGKKNLHDVFSSAFSETPVGACHHGDPTPASASQPRRTSPRTHALGGCRPTRHHSTALHGRGCRQNTMVMSSARLHKGTLSWAASRRARLSLRRFRPPADGCGGGPSNGAGGRLLRTVGPAPPLVWAAQVLRIRSGREEGQTSVPWALACWWLSRTVGPVPPLV